MSIVLKVGILFVLLIAVTCTFVGIGIYSRVSAMVDSEALRSIEFVFTLMDSTLSEKARSTDSIIKEFSLNQSVRNYLRSASASASTGAGAGSGSGERDASLTRDAVSFSDYVSNMRMARPDLFSVNVYSTSGDKLIHSSGYQSSANFRHGISDEALAVMKERGARQYWTRGVTETAVAEQPVIRIYSNIYDLNTLSEIGILEMEMLASSLFASEADAASGGIRAFLINENGILWGPDDEGSLRFIEEISAAGAPAQTQGQPQGQAQAQGQGHTLQTGEGAYFVFKKPSGAGVGTFYLSKLTADMKRANVELLTYTWAVIVAFIMVNMFVAFWISRGMLNPLVRFERLVNRIEPEDPESGMSRAALAEMAGIKGLNNEVGELARSFDALIGKIRASMAKIRQTNDARRKLELELLMSQIKPHFLYNTIEVICSMARLGKTAEIYNLAKSLGVFYRMSLSKGDMFISVQNELAHVESYINIERVRRNYAFEYTVEAAPEVRKLYMLKMILQPIVENALLHGIRSMERGGAISICARRRGGELVFEVMDNGEGIEPEFLERLNSGEGESGGEGGSEGGGESGVDGAGGGVDGSGESSTGDGAGGRNNGGGSRSEGGGRNNGGSRGEGAAGFGTRNVRSRVKMHYGERYGLTFESTRHYGTKARI
ncbi:MAG: histidine kinase, partial [Clostridiales bacterium]|nr:histidine kinase [Clostridiales bacterium]